MKVLVPKDGQNTRDEIGVMDPVTTRVSSTMSYVNMFIMV